MSQFLYGRQEIGAHNLAVSAPPARLPGRRHKCEYGRPAAASRINAGVNPITKQEGGALRPWGGSSGGCRRDGNCVHRAQNRVRGGGGGQNCLGAAALVILPPTVPERAMLPTCPTGAPRRPPLNLRPPPQIVAFIARFDNNNIKLLFNACDATGLFLPGPMPAP